MGTVMRAYLHLTHPRGTFTLTTVGKNYRYESGRAVKDPSLRQDLLVLDTTDREPVCTVAAVHIDIVAEEVEGIGVRCRDCGLGFVAGSNGKGCCKDYG